MRVWVWTFLDDPSAEVGSRETQKLRQSFESLSILPMGVDCWGPFAESLNLLVFLIFALLTQV